VLGRHTGEVKIKFSSSFISKDRLNLVLILVFFVLVLFSPFVLGDPENFNPARKIFSPLHIQPE